MKSFTLFLIFAFSVLACDPYCDICVEDVCKKCKIAYSIVSNRCQYGQDYLQFVKKVTKQLSSELKSFITFENEIPKSQEKLSLLSLRKAALSQKRELSKMVNGFMVQYSSVIQSIQALEKGVQLKTFVKVENIKNSILDLLDSHTIDTALKKEAINIKINEIDSLITSEFDKILKKIKTFEDASARKIDILEEDTNNTLFNNKSN